MNLIAVVMAAPDHKIRFSEAQSLLDYGFANCSIYEDNCEEMSFAPLSVSAGMPSEISVAPAESFSHTFTSEYDVTKIRKEIVYKEVTAPVKKGDEVGSVFYYYNEKELGSIPLVAKQDVKKANYGDYIIIALKRLFLAG
jgi:D-alanyl-D-alanine carboxypeptidase (penicillin-binding protein 5/6)